MILFVQEIKGMNDVINFDSFTTYLNVIEFDSQFICCKVYCDMRRIYCLII